MRPILFSLCALALAGCGAQPEQPVANEVAVNAAGNAADNAVDHVAAIEALSEDQQAAVFFRAIRDAGVACRAVVKVEKTEPWQGIPSWLADCEAGDQHLIQVKADGSAVVVSRTTR